MDDIVETYKIKSKLYKKYKSRYIKIPKNRLRILESLMNDGSKKIYIDKNGKTKYSEHSGLLDFGLSTLKRIIVNTKNVNDKIDHDILLPDNMDEAIDYEYLFHTHPNTNGLGGRYKEGVFYEFPSTSDIFHFIEHYNLGVTQGSIIIAPEGIYIIKSIDNKKKIVIKNYQKLYDKIEDKMFDIQDNAIKKYVDKNFNDNVFYNKVINDYSFLKILNNFLKPLNIFIFYKKRIKFKNEYILDDLYLKVNPIE